MSFAAPSPPPKEWEADISDTRRRLDGLGDRHLLIVNVADSVPLQRKTTETLAADFADVAVRAEKAGAHAIECYLARTTIVDNTGRLAPCEHSVETSIAIARAVRSSLDRSTPLILKLSADLPDSSLEAIVYSLVRDNQIDGVSGISPLTVTEVTSGGDGDVLWGEDKHPAVAGYALRKIGEEFVARLATLRRKHGLRFDIIAMGGIMTPEDVSGYLALGASAVQAASAAICDPDLARVALEYHMASALPQQQELWDCIVVDVDLDTGTFWASVSGTKELPQDMDAVFELDEVHPDQRRNVCPGAVFRWTTGFTLDGTRMLRQSSIRFEPSLRRT